MLEKVTVARTDLKGDLLHKIGGIPALDCEAQAGELFSLRATAKTRLHNNVIKHDDGNPWTNGYFVFIEDGSATIRIQTKTGRQMHQHVATVEELLATALRYGDSVSHRGYADQIAPGLWHVSGTGRFIGMAFDQPKPMAIIQLDRPTEHESLCGLFVHAFPLDEIVYIEEVEAKQRECTDACPRDASTCTAFGSSGCIHKMEVSKPVKHPRNITEGEQRFLSLDLSEVDGLSDTTRHLLRQAKVYNLGDLLQLSEQRLRSILTNDGSRLTEWLDDQARVVKEFFKNQNLAWPQLADAPIDIDDSDLRNTELDEFLAQTVDHLCLPPLAKMVLRMAECKTVGDVLHTSRARTIEIFVESRQIDRSLAEAYARTIGEYFQNNRGIGYDPWPER